MDPIGSFEQYQRPRGVCLPLDMKGTSGQSRDRQYN